MKEKEIINGIISGNEVILKLFYRKHLPYIRSYVLKHGGTAEDAEDIFQDALILIYSKLRSNEIEITTSLSAYFSGICKNLWRNQARKDRRWIMADLLTDPKDEQITVCEQLTQKDRKHLFYSYFTTLQESTKQLWQLIFDEKSTEEIVETMGYTKKYVRKKKCETKKKLIQHISTDPRYSELIEIS
ncbi:RNA polymerase sigma factor [Aquimarina sp. AU474]|uniref:RNA polymerase sigma factor n=1 Tax=Aquimarina sp. AU474 TaxID=2108529 RepID=UPI001356A41C|nr:sigma-70 family RNA polymerase sigma factor [Aquimarina sp. AU474]